MIRLERLFLPALIAVSLAFAAAAQVAREANTGYQTREQRDRLAQRLDSEDREKRQKPRKLLEAIGIRRGDVIADIGSGPGFMIPYFLEKVGPEGKVYAEDIQQDFLAKVEEKSRENGWQNVITVLGGQTDPKLPPAAIDLAFILDAYHHFEYPVKTMLQIKKALKPSGRLVVVDFYRSREHPTMTPERLRKHIREDRDGFTAEIESAGFQLVRQFDHLPHQYVLIFEKQQR